MIGIHQRVRMMFPLAEFDAVVIGTSLGGLDALAEVLGPLSADFPAPVLLVHHVHSNSPGYLPALIGRLTRLEVKHAECGERLRPGTIYVGVPGRHLVITGEGTCGQVVTPLVNFVRPSADLLFNSAAEVLGERALAVVLTGRARDGAAGAAAIRSAGGLVLAQAPGTCREPGMPRAAMQLGAVHFALPPAALGAALVALVTVPGARALFGEAVIPQAAYEEDYPNLIRA